MRTRVILNPVDIARVERLSEEEWPESIDSSVPNLFYSARLQKHKRPDVLIEAFRLVRQHAPAKLWICGEGPMRGRIERMIEKYALRPHVRMVGFRENTFPLLKAATVAVATSDYEGLPNNILEAQALGIPVASARSSFGPEEIIQHQKTGLLTETGNPQDVAKAVIRLISDSELHANMSITAREEIRADPVTHLHRLLAFAGIEVRDEVVRDAVEFASFSNMRQMEVDGQLNWNALPGGKNVNGFKTRRAKVEGYRDELNADDLAMINQVIDEQLNSRFSRYFSPQQSADAVRPYAV